MLVLCYQSFVASLPETVSIKKSSPVVEAGSDQTVQVNDIYWEAEVRTVCVEVVVTMP